MQAMRHYRIYGILMNKGVKGVEKKHNENLYYDEEEIKTISEQIMDAYHSGVVDHDELYYNPKREVGE
jgi:hypothetical protein